MRRNVSSEAPVEYEATIIERSGIIKDVLVKVAMIPGTSRSVSSLLDISDRKLAEKALRESERKLLMVLNSVHAGIMIISGDNLSIIEANTTAAEMIGIPKNLLVGKKYHDYFWCDKSKQPNNFKQDIFHHNAEGMLKTEEGEMIPILKNVTPIELNGGECLLETFIDIQALKKAQDEKTILELQLIRAQKMEAIGTLAGGIAHDFNNILCTIIGYAELSLLDLPKNDSRMQKYLDGILSGSYRAKDLVKQILTFSRNRERVLKHIEIYPVIKEGLNLLKATLPSTIRINESISTEKNTVLADATHIHQVDINNALKVVIKLYGLCNG